MKYQHTVSDELFEQLCGYPAFLDWWKVSETELIKPCMADLFSFCVTKGFEILIRFNAILSYAEIEDVDIDICNDTDNSVGADHVDPTEALAMVIILGLEKLAAGDWDES